MLKIYLREGNKYIQKLRNNYIKDIENIFSIILDNDYFVNLYIIDNNKIKILNEKYRKIDKETDVLSFANIDSGELFPQLDDYIDLGEIFISFEKIGEQAKLYKVSIEREFVLILIHGILHLLSFDHMNTKDAEEMEYLENLLVDKVFINK